MFDWSLNSWIIVCVGFLAATACSTLGVFLVLRQMTLVADAISHAVLPGIAAAFLLSHSRDPFVMLAGAGAVGILATILIEWIHRTGRIQPDASIGVVFTSFFALGVAIISAKAGMIDLDQDCVLYGEIAYAPWDTLIIGGSLLGPRPLWILGFATLMNGLFVRLFYKELQLSTFDPALATSLGFSAVAMHYILMSLVSLTTVAAFETVGAILVVAMFVVPAAAAYLLTDRLGAMFSITLGINVAIAVGGYALARALDASVAGSMTVVGGVIFFAAMLAAPRHGILPRWTARLSLRLRIGAEDWLARLYRMVESAQPLQPDLAGSKLAKSRWLPYILKRQGLIKRGASDWRLTETGMRRAVEIIRRHRGWEEFLHGELNLPADHVHPPAHDAEHYLDEMVDERDSLFDANAVDPHGRIIPPPRE